ncbi:MAG: aldolase catalytic domain-containing protein, partial [Selenomonadaceae bacterium]|nr:aldolase catalytic domain-containing protein [Selenomonadaceae bacterium]
MSNAIILDCTLRDGGYCNQWTFGEKNIKKIILELIHADVDIIECGFLTERIKHKPDITKFNAIDELKDFIPKDKQDKLFVIMANSGEYSFDKLPNATDACLDGIRLAFHKKDIEQAFREAEIIKDKGYKLFLQPMVSLNYTDEEFITLLKKSNDLEPYSFYIVDSFGAMKREELLRLFYLVEHNLKSNVKIGFHGHNNLQLAYSNAQTLMEIPTVGDLLIDSSIYGMGRGAGNLNTELLISYLNGNRGAKYLLSPILSVIDEILINFYDRHPWGFTLAHYISAIHNAHPNYASYLDDKKTLTVERMNEIFWQMDADKKSKFDPVYIEDLYGKYMERGNVYEAHLDELRKKLQGKTVLLIGPGKSTNEAKEKIRRMAKNNDTA